MRELSEPSKVVLGSIDSMMQVLMAMLGECEASLASWSSVEQSCSNNVAHLRKRVDGLNWELSVYRDAREKILSGMEVNPENVIT